MSLLTAKRLPNLLGAMATVCVMGCASLGTTVQGVDTAGGAPSAQSVLADLQENAEAIRSFRAAGTFTLSSPEFDAIKRFRSGRIMFRRPSDLYIQGNHRITNMPLFKLISVGKEFLIEVPTNYKQNYYQLDGEDFEDVPFSVSPSDIAREIFLPEDWGRLARREVRVVDYDDLRGIVTLHIGPRGRPRRIVEAALIDREHPVWAVVRHERLEEGTTVAVTTFADYRVQDSIRYPASVDTYFPSEDTRLTLSLRTMRLNLELPEDLFDVRGRALELNLIPASSDLQRPHTVSTGGDTR